MKKQRSHSVAEKIGDTDATPERGRPSHRVPGGDKDRKNSGRGGVAPPTIDEIWSRFSIRLGRFIRSRVADSSTSEDILQDVFVKLQERLNDIKDPVKIEGWIFLVARNAVIDFYRAKSSAARRPAPPPTELHRIDTAEMDELHSKLRQLIEQLSEEDRQAIMLTTFDGFSQEALAVQLGISLSGAKSRVQRARARLKEILLDFCQREISRTGCSPCPRGQFPMKELLESPTRESPEKSTKKID